MEIKQIHYKEIKPYWRNPRKNDKTIKPLKEAIKKFGFLVPIVIDESNVIVTGHSRYKAVSELVGNLDEIIKKLKKSKTDLALAENLKQINKGNIPCIYGKGLTDNKVKEFRISDNKIPESSEWDLEALETELKTIRGAIGFDLNELTQLIGDSVVEFENYTEEEINAERDRLNEHFSDLSNEGNQYVDLICPNCSEEFSIKKESLK